MSVSQSFSFLNSALAPRVPHHPRFRAEATEALRGQAVDPGPKNRWWGVAGSSQGLTDSQSPLVSPVKGRLGVLLVSARVPVRPAWEEAGLRETGVPLASPPCELEMLCKSASLPPLPAEEPGTFCFDASTPPAKHSIWMEPACCLCKRSLAPFCNPLRSVSVAVSECPPHLGTGWCCGR